MYVSGCVGSASKCGGTGASGIIDAQWRWMELCGAMGSEGFKIKLGRRPLFVYY